MRHILPGVGTLGRRILTQITSGSIEEPSALVPATFDTPEDLSNPDFDPPHNFFLDRFDQAEMLHDASLVQSEALNSRPLPPDAAPQAAPGVSEPPAVPSTQSTAATSEVSD